MQHCARVRWCHAESGTSERKRGRRWRDLRPPGITAPRHRACLVLGPTSAGTLIASYWHCKRSAWSLGAHAWHSQFLRCETHVWRCLRPSSPEKVDDALLIRGCRYVGVMQPACEVGRGQVAQQWQCDRSGGWPDCQRLVAPPLPELHILVKMALLRSQPADEDNPRLAGAHGRLAGSCCQLACCG